MMVGLINEGIQMTVCPYTRKDSISLHPDLICLIFAEGVREGLSPIENY